MKSNDILKRLKEKYGESKESQDAGDGMTGLFEEWSSHLKSSNVEVVIFPYR